MLQGAIVTFTKGLSHELIGKGIRVNCIAPGPVWTPLIPSSFNEETVSFESSTALAVLTRIALHRIASPAMPFLALHRSG